MSVFPAQVTSEEYAAAQPDPIAPFSAPVAGHMNDDHADATAAMIKHYVGLTGRRAGRPGGSVRPSLVDWPGNGGQCL